MLLKRCSFLAQNALHSCRGCDALRQLYRSIHANASVTIVEHVVLFKLKEDAPSTVLMKQLMGLRDIEGVLQLNVGSALNTQLGGWTHALYGRYRDKSALAAYAVHPRHLKVVKYGDETVEDKLAVDWEANVDREPARANFEAARLVLLKGREGVSDEKIASLMLELSSCPGINGSTAGPNYSPARAKGFQWGFAAQFRSVGDLEELQARKEHERILSSELVEGFELFDLRMETSSRINSGQLANED